MRFTANCPVCDRSDPTNRFCGVRFCYGGNGIRHPQTRMVIE